MIVDIGPRRSVQLDRTVPGEMDQGPRLIDRIAKMIASGWWGLPSTVRTSQHEGIKLTAQGQEYNICFVGARSSRDEILIRDHAAPGNGIILNVNGRSATGPKQTERTLESVPPYRYIHAVKRSCFSGMLRWCKDSLFRDRPVEGTVMSNAATDSVPSSSGGCSRSLPSRFENPSGNSSEGPREAWRRGDATVHHTFGVSEEPPSQGIPDGQEMVEKAMHALAQGRLWPTHPLLLNWPANMQRVT